MVNTNRGNTIVPAMTHIKKLWTRVIVVTYIKKSWLYNDAPEKFINSQKETKLRPEPNRTRGNGT